MLAALRSYSPEKVSHLGLDHWEYWLFGEPLYGLRIKALQLRNPVLQVDLVACKQSLAFGI